MRNCHSCDVVKIGQAIADKIRHRANWLAD